MIPLLALWLTLHAPPAPAFGGTPAPDAEALLLAARERLATAGTYPEAIALYREVLATDPDAVEARMELARVLSWSGRHQEAIEEYDRALLRSPDHELLRLERAEVLSWAGRYPEARAELEGLLAEEPDGARAQRALARVHRWSGDALRADRAYRRALALEEDTEARAEWDELRRNFRPGVGFDLRARNDSDSFERIDAMAAHERWIDLATKLELRAGRIRVDRPQRKASPEARQAHEDDSGTELALRAVRKLDTLLELEGELGARDWRFAPGRAFGHAELRLFQSEATAWTLRLDHGDWIDQVDSFEAGQRGLHHTGLSASLWRQLSPRFESWTGVDLDRVSDGNLRQNAGTSLTLRPRADHALALSLGASVTHTKDRSPFYYDPRLDLGLGLRVQDRFQLAPPLSLRLEAGAGPGSSRTDSGTELGTQFSGLAELRFVRGPWSAGLLVESMISQRSESYRQTWGRLEVRRSF